MHYWKVNINQKTESTNRPGTYFYTPALIGVLALTAEEAINKVKAVHPECKIHAVNHNGIVNIT